jgi:hypothetical protein
MTKQSVVQVKMWYDPRTDEMIYGMNQENNEKFNQAKKNSENFKMECEAVENVMNTVSDITSNYIEFYSLKVNSNIISINSFLTNVLKVKFCADICSDLYDKNYSKAMSSISIETVSWGLKQAIQSYTSKKNAYALCCAETIMFGIAAVCGIRQYTEGKIEDIDSLLGSFCEAKQNEWNSKELEPWEKMLNSIYHMDGGFNLTKTLNEFSKGKLSLWQSNKMEKWEKMLNAMYLCDETDVTHPFGTAATMQKVDPIALDLNGDGITFGSATDGYAQFDLDNNGFKERAAWLNNADGFLVRDINGNGLIDDGSELFGDQTALKNGKTATDGFEALKDLDDNKDGILDKLDKTFQAIKIWQDKDRDGITDEGELSSLADLGITSFSVNGKATNTKDHNGNTLNKEGSYTKADGTRGKMGEYALTRDTVHSEAADAADGEYSEAIKAAPDLAGQGNVVNLRRAMAEDKTGDLYKYVQKFITAATESERTDWLDKITEITAFIEHFKVQGGAMEFFATAFMNNLNFLEMADWVASAQREYAAY